jgi:hypothetical protein
VGALGMLILDVPTFAGVYVVLAEELLGDIVTEVAVSAPALVLSLASRTVTGDAPGRKVWLAVGCSDTGSSDTKLTYTVEGGEKVVVCVPPLTVKPLGLNVTVKVAVLKPGADAVIVTIPELARAAR